MTLLSTTYCTQSDMERKLGAQAIIEWSDHNADTVADDDVVDDAINQATGEIDLACRQRYSQAGLATSELINRWATVLACYFLATNRGNPPPESLAAEFQRIMEKLQQVAEGLLQLPGVAMRNDMRPTHSNLRIDRRYIQSKIRVEKATSTDSPTTLKQNKIEDIPSTVL